MNPNPEQQDQEVVQPKLTAVAPHSNTEEDIKEKLAKLGTKRDHAEIMDFEKDIDLLTGIYSRRIDKKREVIETLKKGGDAPTDIEDSEGEWREKYEMFKTKLDKAFTVVGRSEYGELIEAMDAYREEKKAELAKLDEEIADIKAEKEGKKGDQAEADKIRESLKEAA